MKSFLYLKILDYLSVEEDFSIGTVYQVCSERLRILQYRMQGGNINISPRGSHAVPPDFYIKDGLHLLYFQPVVY